MGATAPGPAGSPPSRCSLATDWWPGAAGQPGTQVAQGWITPTLAHWVQPTPHPRHLGCLPAGPEVWHGGMHPPPPGRWCAPSMPPGLSPSGILSPRGPQSLCRSILPREDMPEGPPAPDGIEGGSGAFWPQKHPPGTIRSWPCSARYLGHWSPWGHQGTSVNLQASLEQQLCSRSLGPFQMVRRRFGYRYRRGKYEGGTPSCVA